MATIIDIPDAAGTWTEWTGSYVDLQTDNGDVSCAFTDTTNARITCNFPDLPAGILDPVNSCYFVCKMRATSGSPTANLWNGTSWIGPTATLGGGYADYAQLAASMVVATLQAYEGGAQRNSFGVGNNINFTYLTRQADVSYPPGGFSYLIGSLLAGLSIGATLTFREFTAALSTFGRGMGRRWKFTRPELEMGYRFYRRTQTPELAWL